MARTPIKANVRAHKSADRGPRGNKDKALLYPGAAAKKKKLNPVERFGATVAPPDILRQGVGMLTQVVVDLGGEFLPHTPDDGIEVEVAPLVVQVGTVMAEALPTMVGAQQATGTTPGVLIEIIGKESSMVKTYGSAVRAGDRVSFTQSCLAAQVRQEQDKINNEVQRMLGTLPPEQRRALLADYEEVKAELDKIAGTRIAQVGKTRKDTVKKAADLNTYVAHGDLLHTIVDLKDGLAVDEADLAQAVETASRETTSTSPTTAPARHAPR